MKEKELIGICIDIRNSTKMVDEIGIEKTTKLIKDFIEKIYEKLQSYQKLKDRARHQGDGILITLVTEDDGKAFIHVKKFLESISPIIKKTEKFKVGIGLDFGKSIEVAIKNSPHSDKSLIIGNSLSTSVKICSQVPFNINNKNYFIKASKDFLKKAEWDEHLIKWNAKKSMGFINLD